MGDSLREAAENLIVDRARMLRRQMEAINPLQEPNRYDPLFESYVACLCWIRDRAPARLRDVNR